MSILGVAVLTAGAAGAPARPPEQTSRTVYVTVVDNQGQAVTGLTPADFRLRENNRDREIVSVEPATEPMRFGIVAPSKSDPRPTRSSPS